MQNQPIDIPNIRIVTVSGRIASGSTTLAKHLAKTLGWKHIEGGEIFWEMVRNKLGLSSKETDKRPDREDLEFDQSLKKILKEEKNIVLETKLAGFNAQGIDDIFKILVVCNNEKGEDQTQIRIDRLVNREKMSIEKAKEEVLEREKNDIEKYQRLYADNNKNWVYWEERYYDLVINTFDNDQQATLKIALNALGYKH